MSSFSVCDYPTLREDDELFTKLGFSTDEIRFSYKDSDGKHELVARSSDGATARSSRIELEDVEGLWDQNQCPFYVEMGGILQSPKFLFGEKGVVPENDSAVGVAIIWTDRSSKIRGCEPIGMITSDISGQPYQYSKTLIFEPGLLRGTLTLRLVLYLYKNGVAEKGEETYFATRQGTLLGTLDEIKVVLEGNGSIFPISDTYEPDEPLWWIRTRFTDILTDPFDDDHFVLVMNKAHSAYEYVNYSEETNSYGPLFNEILASAIFTLVMEITATFDDGKQCLENNEPCDSGSVCDVLRRMLRQFGWIQYLDEPDQLSKAIHRTVENLWK